MHFPLLDDSPLMKQRPTTLVYKNGGYAIYHGKFPSEVHYSNGEWLKFENGEIVEVHTMEDIEAFASSFAAEKHVNQVYGSKPYTFHLAATRAVVAEFGLEGDIIPAAWLHDVVEDTKTPLSEIESLFGRNVAAYVNAVSGVGKTRKERNESVYTKLAAYPRGVALKLADRIANTTHSKTHKHAVYHMYVDEYATFRGRLYSLMLWDAAVDKMWKQLDSIMEYNEASK